MSDVTIYVGDCLQSLRKLADNSVDSIVTDPPYGLGKQPDAMAMLRDWMTSGHHEVKGRGFMNKQWDAFVPQPAVWAECLRVLKPGGHLLAFAGTRTMDLMGLSLRLAGFELRDSIGYAHDGESNGAPLLAWCYSTGFPKNLDVSKAIDASDAIGARRERQLRFTEWMRSTGLTSARIDELTGTNMGGHYTTAASQPAVATREHFEKLRPHINVEIPDWIEQLIDWRTVESENMKKREVVGEKSSGLSGGSGVTVGKFTDSRNENGMIDITTAHTPAAKQWEGWGTALKPAFEPVIVARKPLMTAGINVLQVVESQLRERGVRGEILWKPEPASVATKRKRQINSSSIEAPKVVGTSAESAAVSETQSAGQKTETSSALGMLNGANQTVTMSASTTSKSEMSCAAKCSQPTAGNAHAAGKPSATFSLSTTSTAVETRTENPCMARSITSLSEKDSRLDTECFAGIVTGLTGSMAHVLINRDASGFYLWPQGLPEHVPGTPLTVADNVQRFGTGAINVDGCRTEERWPANLIHDNSEAVTSLLGKNARFFHHPKASKRDRDEGCEALPVTAAADMVDRDPDSDGMNSPRAGAGRTGGARNHHPTVKPTEVMRWLVRLVTPPGGVVLDPFMGSGSTGKAAILEGFNFIGCELDPGYTRIAVARIGHVMAGKKPRVVLPVTKEIAR